MPNKLGLSPEQIGRCRLLARQVADGVREETGQYTTVSTERTVLRLLGVDGVDADDVPIPNRVVESLQASGKLGRGAALWMGSALAEGADGIGIAEAAALLRKAAPGDHGAARPR